MLLQGIYAATAGMRVSSTRLNQSAHNIANANTPGFVPNRIEQASMEPAGVRVTGSTPTSQGPIIPTDQPLDLAIDGSGFFMLGDGQGGTVYSRGSAFMLNQNGQVVDPQGRPMQPGFTVPPEAVSVHVSPQGQIQALGADGQILAQAQIETANFGNPSGLQPLGGNVYQAGQASGPPVTGQPGAEGRGVLISGALRGSGTDLAKEMVNQIIDQRTFEANLRTAQTLDDMLGTVLDIKS